MYFEVIELFTYMVSILHTQKQKACIVNFCHWVTDHNYSTHFMLNYDIKKHNIEILFLEKSYSITLSFIRIIVVPLLSKTLIYKVFTQHAASVCILHTHTNSVKPSIYTLICLYFPIYICCELAYSGVLIYLKNSPGHIWILP